MRPVDWKELRKVCASLGWTYDRHNGDHYIMVREGATRPVVIPKKKELREGIVFSIAKTAGLTAAEIKRALQKGGKRKTNR